MRIKLDNLLIKGYVYNHGLEEIEKIDYESVSLAPYTTSRKINEIIERLNLLIRLKNGEINNGPTS